MPGKEQSPVDLDGPRWSAEADMQGLPQGLSPEELAELGLQVGLVDQVPVDELKDDAEDEFDEENHGGEFAGDLGPFSLLIRDVGKLPLLTHEEEIELGARKDMGLNAKEKLDASNGRLSSKRRKKLENMVVDGEDALWTLVTHNVRLVMKAAKKHYGQGVEPADLVQEGILGLIRGAEKYDQERGYRFSTYATWWIRQALTRAVADQGRTIRLPVHRGDFRKKMRKVENRMAQQLHRAANLEELSDALGQSPDKVKFLQSIFRDTLSLDEKAGEGMSTLGELVPDDSESSTVDQTTYAFLKEQMRDLLDRLHPRQALVLALRFGLKDGREYTLEEVGMKLGVTRERVRQIEAKALWNLKLIPGIKEQFKGYLEE